VTSLERILAVCSGNIPDRVPFLLASREFSSRQAGMTLPECYTQPERYVASQVQMVEQFGVDGVYDLWCTPVVDELLGARLEFPADGSPRISGPVVGCLADVLRLPKVDPRREGRAPYLLDLVRRLKAAVGDSVAVVAWASSPFRTASMLRGVTEFYRDLKRDPACAKALLDAVYGPCTAYGKALVEAGADIVCSSNPGANMQCISRAHYQEFSHPYSSAMFREIKKHGAKAVMFHTCGKWDDRLDLVVQENIDIIHLDRVDIADFKARHSGSTVLMGNLSAVDVLLQGDESSVEQAARDCLARGKGGGRYILSADCSVPRDTPPGNLRAVARAVRAFGGYLPEELVAS
jgi:uroporphyrinogen decarboxylase